MIFDATEFVFQAPEVISRARRVLIKPSAAYPVSYPVTTSRHMLSSLIEGIRQISDADILILEGTPEGSPIYPVYEALEYNFPRVIMLDVKDCIWVEVDNPLPKPFIATTFWMPNVVLSSDYLITVSPLKVFRGRGNLSIMNLLNMLPSGKYDGEAQGDWRTLQGGDLDKLVADLYFTLPFDLGIIEARQKFIIKDDQTRGEIQECGKTFAGEPYEVDREASETLGLKTGYLDLIKTAKVEFKILSAEYRGLGVQIDLD